MIISKKKTMERQIDIDDFSAICRLCLRTPIENGVRLSQIFPRSSTTTATAAAAADANQNDLANMMYTCLDLKPKCTDQLPQTICTDCGRLLASFHNFRITSKSSDEHLRQALLAQSATPSLLTPVHQVSEVFLLENETIVKSSPRSSSDDAFSSDSDWAADEQKINEDNLDNNLLVNRGRTRGRKKGDKANNKEQCPDCGLFVRFLNQHMITHSNKKPHECEICQMTFTRASSLKKHVRFVHMDIRNFKCPECDKAFHNRYSLKSHLRTHATAGPPPILHACEICQQSFSTEKAMQRHRSDHYTGTIYECETCQKRFVSKEKLKLHERGHTDEYPFKCPDCDAIGFASNCKLQLHRRQHTGGKPYKCAKCDESFRYRSDLAEHLKDLHDIAINPHKTIFEQMASDSTVAINDEK